MPTSTTRRVRGASPHPAGFTLIELLIASALFSVILLLIINALLLGLRTRQSAVNVSDLHKTQSNIVNDITNEVRWAKNVAVATDIINVTSADDKQTLYEHVGEDLIKTNPDGARLALNREAIAVKSFLMVINSSDGRPTGFSYYIWLVDRKNPAKEVESINPISVRLNQSITNL